MGNCYNKAALKVIIEGRHGRRVSYITSKQLRNIRTYNDFFRELGILTTHFKYMYAILVQDEVKFLHLSDDFKIKNLILYTNSEYHIAIENMYRC